MQRKSGASLAALVEATGWLPHTTRAALTGLRQKGYAIERDKSPHGKTVYRLPARARG
jgi:DNA-binding IclR family transcriptional regulator